MKKFFVLLFIVALCFPFSACNRQNHLDQAQFSALSQNGQMVLLLSSDLTEGRYKAVLKKYPITPAVESAFSPAVLYSVMFDLVAENGKFNAIEEVLFEQSDFCELYYVNLIFSKGKAALCFSLNEENQIADFTLAPYKDRTTLQTPLVKEFPSGAGEENVIIGSQFKLSGKLIVPEGGTDSVVILIHDSGSSNMDGSNGQNSPYRDIAYDLVSHGVASLRYDNRSFMYGEVVATDKSLTPYEETIEDVLYAIDYIKVHNVELKNIYIAGHGLGGYLIPEIAAYTDDVAGYIFLSANNSSFLDLAVLRIESISAGYDRSQKMELSQMQKLLAEVEKAKAIHALTPDDQVILGTYPAYWRWFSEYQPIELVKLIDVPMLFIQGGRDYEVPSSELDSWLSALSTRSDVRSTLLPSLNHMLISGEGLSLPSEYQVPSSVDSSVATLIADFVETSKIHPAIQ